jgi:hypothetical protein
LKLRLEVVAVKTWKLRFEVQILPGVRVFTL